MFPGGPRQAGNLSAANTVSDLQKHGLTQDTVDRFKAQGVQEKDFVDLFNQMGPTAMLTATILAGKMSGGQQPQPAPQPTPTPEENK